MRDLRFVRKYGKITVPESGAFFGADDTTRGFTGPLGIETQLGRRMAIRNRHAGWDAFGRSLKALQTLAAGDVSAGAIPMLSIGAQGWPTDGLTQIAFGDLDDQIEALLAGYEALNAGFILRPMMEMNGSHNAAYYGQPALFKLAFARVASIARKAAPNGVLIFCPQQKSSSGTDPAAWIAYEPADYDWGGLDLYRATFDVAQPFIDHYRSTGRPTVICESGFQQGSVVTDPAGVRYDKDGSSTGHSLILHTRDQVKARPNVIGYLVWNNVGPAGDDYVDTSKLSQSQYREFAHDTYFTA